MIERTHRCSNLVTGTTFNFNWVQLIKIITSLKLTSLKSIICNMWAERYLISLYCGPEV